VARKIVVVAGLAAALVLGAGGAFTSSPPGGVAPAEA